MRFFALFVWMVLALTTGYALFDITFRVEAIEERLARLNREILKEQEALHVLSAEWSFLNRPARMGKLANDLLPEMYELSSAQIALPGDLPERDETPSDAAAPVLPASLADTAGNR